MSFNKILHVAQALHIFYCRSSIMRMKNIIFIGILVSLCVGCKQGGDIRKIPSPGAAGEEQKLFKDIAGSTYTASSLVCSSSSGSSTISDVALKISNPGKRLLDRNKDTQTPILEIKFDA